MLWRLSVLSQSLRSESRDKPVSLCLSKNLSLLTFAFLFSCKNSLISASSPSLDLFGSPLTHLISLLFVELLPLSFCFFILTPSLVHCCSSPFISLPFPFFLYFPVSLHPPLLFALGFAASDLSEAPDSCLFPAGSHQRHWPYGRNCHHAPFVSYCSLLIFFNLFLTHPVSKSKSFRQTRPELLVLKSKGLWSPSNLLQSHRQTYRQVGCIMGLIKNNVTVLHLCTVCFVWVGGLRPAGIFVSGILGLNLYVSQNN